MFADIALWPQRASTTADRVDALLYFLVGITGFAGLVVAVLLIFFAVYYRRRSSDEPPPPKTWSSHALEWAFIVGEFVIFMVLFVWGATVYFGAYRAPDDAVPVYIIAKQWMWKVQHPEGQREINTLHVPLGKPVQLLMTSEDVIHSFFVPEFRIHMDVLPERYTSLWVQPTRVGRYHLFCSQYCGTDHAGMVGEVIVQEPADYQRWLHLKAEGSLAVEGRKKFLMFHCISCHSDDENARAPVLGDLFGSIVHLRDGRTVIADENYLRQSILDPGVKIVAGYENIMPTFRGSVSEEDIVKLIAFIKSLKRGGVPPRVEKSPPPAKNAHVE